MVERFGFEISDLGCAVERHSYTPLPYSVTSSGIFLGPDRHTVMGGILCVFEDDDMAHVRLLPDLRARLLLLLDFLL